jgi:hypothetical protein
MAPAATFSDYYAHCERSEVILAPVIAGSSSEAISGFKKQTSILWEIATSLRSSQ